ncbi:MAG: hypothetical protein P4L84_29470 [Isosphaeraceae bacterium]|nr:hypothetical protein [Isosphaeraceae bacterium]
MFMANVIEAIWAPESDEFARHSIRAGAMSALELYDAVAGRRMEFVGYAGHHTNCNLLLTSGCSHRIRGRKLVGCSMCDYHSSNLEGWALMRALLKKDPELYARAVRTSFEAVRPDRPAPAFCEQVTGNDCLDPVEFPPQALEVLFQGDGLFAKNPRCYMFEVLASHVTKRSVAEFSRRFSRGQTLFFDFGVEATDWLRRHWINKECGDDQVASAIRVLREAGHYSVADVLIGIPGVTEEQSVRAFLDTMRLLDALGVDRVFCLPLNRKRKTLQGFLHERLGQNDRLGALGLSQGEHTGVPWLFTIVEALCRAFEELPTLRGRLKLAAIRSDQVVIENRLAYNANAACACNEQIVAAFERYQKSGEPAHIFAVREGGSDCGCREAYDRIIRKQTQAGPLAETLATLADEIAQELFPADWEALVQSFREELRLLPSEEASSSHNIQNVTAVSINSF